MTRQRHLDDETWGEKVARARSRSGRTLKLTAEAISDFLPVSKNTLFRLEALTEVPADPKRRMVAYLALCVYGYEPEDFGLSINDLPRFITEDGIDALSTMKYFQTTAA